MRILFDTNIIIEREDNKIIDKDLQLLMRILNQLNVSIFLHPKSIEDIGRDEDGARREITLSKMETYNKLKDYPEISTDPKFLEIVGEPKKINDMIDNYLLYAVYRNMVNFLITEDMGLHRKAKKLNLSGRVLTILEAMDIYRREIPKMVKLPPALKATTMANLNINDSIFDSLREDYIGFDDWFVKKARTGRKCWIYQRHDSSLGALLIYKTENELIPSNPPLKRKKRFKIATMKVSHVGHKIGELLLKLSIEYASKNDISELYLTHFTKENDYLVDLIEEYGFKKVAEVDHDWSDIPEDLFLKRLFINREDIEASTPVNTSKIYYPNLYDGSKVKKFIVPIQPKYHDRLFTDFPKRQSTLNEYLGKFIIEGNTIKKAYLSHSLSKKMEPGDNIIFYRSNDLKSVVSLGVIESVHYNVSDPNEITSTVGKRSVYSSSEINEIALRPTTIILFNHHFHFKKPITLKNLLKLDILNGSPQSIMEISHDKYLIIKKRGRIDERFTFN